MLFLSTVTFDINYIDNIIANSDRFIHENDVKLQQKLELHNRIEQAEKDLAEKIELMDRMQRSASLISTTSDKRIRDTLDKITGVINKALSVIFPHDPRTIEIKPSVYREVYTHFNVILYTGVKRSPRSFKLSGTGLGQIVSFLFTLSLIDIRKARRLMVTDELMYGLHPTAKYIIKDIITALSARFQFIVVEYGLDMGTEFEVVRNGQHSIIRKYENGDYYLELQRQEIARLERKKSKDSGNVDEEVELEEA